VPATAAVSAITLETGFINALSAVIGRFIGCAGDAMSTMITELATPVSRTQMKFSLSIVRLVKEMHCGLIPQEVSC